MSRPLQRAPIAAKVAERRSDVRAVILSTVLVLITFVTSAAHVLELPGKLRLDEAAYRRVQAIYYPGFTIAGIAEPLGIATCVAAALILPAGTARVLLTVSGGTLLAAHLVYWIMTHPTNAFWLEGEQLGAAGKAFFAGRRNDPTCWLSFRNRWEASHVIRALLTEIGLFTVEFALFNHAG